MKELNGLELVQYIKERQARQVRGLRQADKVFPKLAILRINDNPVSDSYMRRKQQYGEDILVEVEVITVPQDRVLAKIDQLNKDTSVHGIIVQLPLPDPAQTDEVLNAVAPEKDVDGLGQHAILDPATPLAINWLLAGYNVDLSGQIVIVGHGRLVGRPLAEMWRQSGYNVLVADKETADLRAETLKADVLVCATGVPHLITPDMVQPKAVIVDAGVATDKNGLVGDVSPEVRELPNIKITPIKGGVGPLTVCALFDNVIRAARATVAE